MSFFCHVLAPVPRIFLHLKFKLAKIHKCKLYYAVDNTIDQGLIKREILRNTN